MPDPEQLPKVVAAITLVAGVALTAAPQVAAGPFGLADTRGLRAVGLADLLLVPGLASGRTPSAWMTGRAAVSVMQAAYLDGVAERSAKPGALRAIAGVLLGLTVADAVTAAQLRRRGR